MIQISRLGRKKMGQKTAAEEERRRRKKGMNSKFFGKKKDWPNLPFHPGHLSAVSGYR
jgi:hypothetical protein